jgi:ABC-type phosphate transport system substrate-binding protein
VEKSHRISSKSLFYNPKLEFGASHSNTRLHRKSLTAFTFTDYLTKVDAQWAKRVGAGMVVEWPVGLLANGNEGVSEMVKNQTGAIGYVELSYAIEKGIPYALMQNRAGTWVDASPQTITAGAASLVDQMPMDLQQSITDAPGQSAYPISSYSYLLFFKQQTDSATVESFTKFLDWILHDGQAYAAPLHYAPVPDRIRERADIQLKQTEIMTQTATTSCKANLGLAKGHGISPVNIAPDTAGPLFSD